MSLKGNVTLSLEDYHAFLDTHELNLEKAEKLRITTRELAVFLSYLSTREDISKHIEAFNLQSKTCKIVFEGTRAVIELRKNTNEINTKT